MASEPKGGSSIRSRRVVVYGTRTMSAKMRSSSPRGKMPAAPSAGTEDPDLLIRVARGDRGAFAQLFDRYSSMVLGLLVRMMRQRAEAEEVLQEVFLQAWQQAVRYEPSRGSVLGWLYTLARSRALDRLRSREAERRREETVVREQIERSSTAVGTDRLEAAEREAQVGTALHDLPTEQRLCIELAYFEGLSHSQIADRLQAPLGTVKSRVLMGMRKLRRTLDT